ncbi:hypothetical protein [Micromonospora sp. NPDC005710]|uniref:hypothetical protein n=1 Tax=Micromonospora sp. NPDC005710 TaxID=3157051 RepID=UPI0034021EE9
MSVLPLRVRARVRHESDRTYVVLVDGPDGEVLVGATGILREVRTVAREGAARLFGVTTERVDGDHLDLVIPQPPYGRDGQWVRITSAGEAATPDDSVDVGMAGQAHWFGHEGAWFVTVAGSGTAIYPSEYLDFAPTVTDEEIAELRRYLARSAPSPS